MTVVAPVFADELLAHQVESRVRCRTSGMVRGLRVLLNEGIISIFGRTTSYHAKQLVSAAAKEICCEVPIRNSVEVD